MACEIGWMVECSSLKSFDLFEWKIWLLIGEIDFQKYLANTSNDLFI